jgi:hypothetical protein
MVLQPTPVARAMTWFFATGDQPSMHGLTLARSMSLGSISLSRSAAERRPVSDR